jgi:hypothetical protein
MSLVVRPAVRSVVPRVVVCGSMAPFQLIAAGPRLAAMLVAPRSRLYAITVMYDHHPSLLLILNRLPSVPMAHSLACRCRVARARSAPSLALRFSVVCPDLIFQTWKFSKTVHGHSAASCRHVHSLDSDESALALARAFDALAAAAQHTRNSRCRDILHASQASPREALQFTQPSISIPAG